LLPLQASIAPYLIDNFQTVLFIVVYGRDVFELVTPDRPDTP
jgi:hypothetical protein